VTKINTTNIDVTILGRQFSVACNEKEKDELLRTVKFVDTRMQGIRDNGKVIGVERIAIMAALNIAHELLTTKLEGDLDIGALKGRIMSVTEDIERSLTAQDELF
tara:strand:- start:477 stop:791 length:315 start_codon:yes stop_codon:yes gene_type:complete